MRDSLYHRNKITLCSEGFGSNLRFCNITTAEECAKSDSAWCAAINWWKNPPPSAREKYSKFKFSEAVADFLSGSPAFHCEQIGTHGNGCGIPPSCTGPQLASGAALQPVLLSLSNINSHFANLYEGLRQVDDSTTRIGLKLLNAVFVPKEDKSAEVLLGVLNVAMALGSVTWFNTFLKSTKRKAYEFGQKNKAATDNLKDYSSISINAGFTNGKDLNKGLAAKKLTSFSDKIDLLFTDVRETWKNHIENVNSRVFKGDDDSINILTNLLADGRSISRNATKAEAYANSARKFIFSILIPEVWRMQDYFPVLLDTGGHDCKTPGIGYKQWTDNSRPGSVYCIEQKQYQLWAVKGGYGCKGTTVGGRSFNADCQTELVELPGYKDIETAVPSFGNLNITGMIESAYKGYKNLWNGNHKLDDGDIANFDMTNTIANSLVDGSMDISALPGIVNIPVCGWDEIKENWKNRQSKGKDNTYPCSSSGRGLHELTETEILDWMTGVHEDDD